jgi:hypothetical protein
MERLEKEHIPFGFVRVDDDGTEVYERLDTGEEVSREYLNIFSQGLELFKGSYNGIGTIMTHCPFEEDNALVLRRSEKEDLTESHLYTGDYAYFDEELFKKQEQDSELGSGLSVTR